MTEQQMKYAFILLATNSKQMCTHLFRIYCTSSKWLHDAQLRNKHPYFIPKFNTHDVDLQLAMESEP